MLGGTIWKIVKVIIIILIIFIFLIINIKTSCQDGEEDKVYAVDYNHKNERHLNGCDIERLSRPR